MQFLDNHILSLMIFFPIFASAFVAIIPSSKEKTIKYASFLLSLFPLAALMRLYLKFDQTSTGFQFIEKYPWIKTIFANYHIGIDGLSLMMIALTALIMPISLIASFDYIKTHIKKYYIWLLILQGVLFGVFASMDIFLFYVFWEAMLIPMYFLIGIWGGENKIYATIKFFIYTMAGSLFMLVAFIVMHLAIKNNHGLSTFFIMDFYGIILSPKMALFCFFSLALAFAIKVPLFPLHTWLPDAHVQAPAAASVILAGVLLKMGVYGYLRFLGPMFPDLTVKFSPYIAGLAVFGIIYASMCALVQKDMKKLIAYSSVAHLGLIMLGVLSFKQESVNAAILQMINHGLSTGALFLMAGILYERKHTRMIENYGGIFKTMPYFSSVFMIITLSSIGLPGLNGFVGEFMIFAGAFKAFPTLTAVSTLGVILSAVYMLSMYEKVFYGKIKSEENAGLKDLSVREWFYLLPILFFVFYIGLKPQPFLNKTDKYASAYCELSKGKTIFKFNGEAK